MFRYLRIAILPLDAVVMPLSHAMADGSPVQSQVLTRPLPPHLIRVQDYEAHIARCRRACDADYQECLELTQRYTYLEERHCVYARGTCYRNCDR